MAINNQLSRANSLNQLASGWLALALYDLERLALAQLKARGDHSEVFRARWVMDGTMCIGEWGKIGGGDWGKIGGLKLRTTLHTTNLCLQNGFGESHT